MAETPDSKKSVQDHSPESGAGETGAGKPVGHDSTLDPLETYRPFPQTGGRVCITHGRDQIMNKQVVSLIRELGINPVVMQDKANQAKTFGQFITDYPDVSFVIAILSADDWAYPKNGKPKDSWLYADQKVVFHLGFWIGRLGRSRVFALHYDQRSFRWPTEHINVIYTPLDQSGIWKNELTQRLQAVGIEIIGRCL